MADDKTKASEDIKDVNKIEKKSGNKETMVDTKLETTLDKEIDTDSNIQEKKELFQIKEPVKDENKLKKTWSKLKPYPKMKNRRRLKFHPKMKHHSRFKILTVPLIMTKLKMRKIMFLKLILTLILK